MTVSEIGIRGVGNIKLPTTRPTHIQLAEIQIRFLLTIPCLCYSKQFDDPLITIRVIVFSLTEHYHTWVTDLIALISRYDMISFLQSSSGLLESSFQCQ